MNPNRFDQIARSLADRRSRRQVIAQLGGAALSGIAGSLDLTRGAMAQTEPAAVATPGTRPTFPPIGISRTRTPLFPEPNLYPVVAFNERGMVPVFGPTDEFLRDEFSGAREGFPDIFGVIDGNVVPILEFVPIAPEFPGTPTIDPFPEGPCGVDDAQEVEYYEEKLGVARQFVDDHQAPVGNIRWNEDLESRYPGEAGNVSGLRWCSGTLIEDDLFLTAGHCFEPDFGGFTTPRVNDVAIGRAEIATNMHVNFNYQWGFNAGPRPVVSVPIAELMEDRLGNRDYAIVRLERNPGSQFSRGRISRTDAPEGSTLCVIGHPDRLPKRVANGHASEYQPPRLYYDDLDTAGGSSGSGLLIYPEGLLVGIHTNGGCDLVQHGNNHGFSIQALLEFSPLLSGLAEA